MVKMEIRKIFTYYLGTAYLVPSQTKAKFSHLKQGKEEILRILSTGYLRSHLSPMGEEPSHLCQWQRPAMDPIC